MPNRERIPRGWRLDKDRWYVRPIKPTDVRFDDCSIGFTTDRKVYVMQREHCLDYDRGKILNRERKAARPASQTGGRP